MATDKNTNRAVILLVFGLIITSWVMVNSGEWIRSAFIFIVMGLTSIVLILNWNKIRGFGK